MMKDNGVIFASMYFILIFDWLVIRQSLHLFLSLSDRYLSSTGATHVVVSSLASPHDRIKDKAAYLVCLLAFEDEGVRVDVSL